MTALFDADDYTRGTPRQPRTRQPRVIVESDGGWHVVANRAGVLDHVHRVDRLRTDARRSKRTLDDVAVLTACRRIGRIVTTPRIGTEVYPCPACQKVPR